MSPAQQSWGHDPGWGSHTAGWGQWGVQEAVRPSENEESARAPECFLAAVLLLCIRAGECRGSSLQHPLRQHSQPTCVYVRAYGM